MLKQQLAVRLADLQDGARRLRDEITQLEELTAQRHRDLFATQGAIDECAFWITRIDTAEMQAAQVKMEAALDAQENEPIKETSRETMNEFVRLANGHDDDDELDRGY